MKRLFEDWEHWRRRRIWTRKGSSTMEYVIVITVGALFAGLLYMTMSDGEGLIQSALEKKILEIIQGRLPEGDMPSGDILGINGASDFGNAPGLGDPIGRNPEIGGFSDAGTPPELRGPSNRSGINPGMPPVANRVPSSTPGGGSGSLAISENVSASSLQADSGEKGWLSRRWDKTKNYVASGQMLKDAAHVGKETLDFLVLDDVSGCFTGKDTDGNQLAGWERGLSCVSFIPAAKVAKLGKFADEALTFAGKLDDKLAETRFGEDLQTAKRKLEDRFNRGKEAVCGCDDDVGKKVAKKRNTVEQVIEVHSYERVRNLALDILGDLGPTARPYYGKFRDAKSRIVGRMSVDKKKLWRLDWDPEKGTHINVEDYRRGTARSGKGVKVAIKFPGDYDYYLALLRRLNK